MPLMLNSYVNVWVPPSCTASPLPFTTTTTSWRPAGPSPMSHWISVSEEEVTSQATPPIITEFSAVAVLNPFPVIVSLVPADLEPAVGVEPVMDGVTLSDQEKEQSPLHLLGMSFMATVTYNKVLQTGIWYTYAPDVLHLQEVSVPVQNCTKCQMTIAVENCIFTCAKFVFQV